MIAETGAAIGSIKAAMDIVKGATGLKSETEINLAVINIQRALLDAQSAAFDDRERHTAQQRRVTELELELAKVHQWEEEKARYQLTECATGTLVYVLKEDFANGDPVHRLCVKCFDEDRKSVLQVENRHSGGESVRCHHCNNKMVLSPFPRVKIDMGRASGWAS